MTALQITRAVRALSIAKQNTRVFDRHRAEKCQSLHLGRYLDREVKTSINVLGVEVKCAISNCRGSQRYPCYQGLIVKPSFQTPFTSSLSLQKMTGVDRPMMRMTLYFLSV
jgi:hypothetical protein